MSKFSEVVDWCLNSLDTEPEAWSPYRIDGKAYRLTHRNGVSIWMANGHSGLGIAPSTGILGTEVGGVTAASVFVGALIPWRRKVLAAARRVAGHDAPAKSRVDAVLDVIRA